MPFIFTACVGLAWCASEAPADDVICMSCHSEQAAQLAGSVHGALQCQECHGGAKSYDLSPEEVRRYTSGSGTPSKSFDHGAEFAGPTDRKGVPELCGTCHANVERMNPYGLRTDQLARYWTSGHGKTLRGKGDDRVAVCTDCHGSHGVLSASVPNSKSNPLNVPDTCGHCHADEALMADFALPTQVVGEYRESVHGQLLLGQGDTGAPTCATCHGNHSAMPPGFATVGAVCGQCHLHAAAEFAKSVHADLDGFNECVQCHGGGEASHYHLIERITKPSGVLIQRYAHLLSSEPSPTPQQVTAAINPEPRKIIERTLPTCLECHEGPDDDENLPKLFALIDEIAGAERRYVETANRLDRVGQGVLLVDNQRFKFQDAKTHLIGLAPLQHSLDNDAVAEKVLELNAVCATINSDLDELERGLQLRRRALIPIWALAVVFAAACYVKFHRLKAAHVKPQPKSTD